MMDLSFRRCNELYHEANKPDKIKENEDDEEE
jgi:hypothetical protein